MGLLQTQSVLPSPAGMQDWAVRVDEKLVCGVGMRFQNYNLRKLLWRLHLPEGFQLSMVKRCEEISLGHKMNS